MNVLSGKHSYTNWPYHSIFFEISALLNNPVAETHEQDLQNLSRLKCAEIDNVFPTARGR